MSGQMLFLVGGNWRTEEEVLRREMLKILGLDRFGLYSLSMLREN